MVESYQPIEVAFEAGISISLSVKVLFFSITLSFSATIRESFTIGQAAPTPWALAGPALPAAATPQLAPRGIQRTTGGVVRASPVFAQVLAAGISWHGDPALAAPAQPGLTVGVYVQPMLTAGLDGDRPDQPLGTQPQPQLVATLFVADRGQLEGALAVANADLPLRGRHAHRTGRRQVTAQAGDTFRSLAGPAATSSSASANRRGPEAGGGQRRSPGPTGR